MTDTAGGRLQTEEIRGALGRHRRQHRAVHRGQDRQRPALSRLRHSRYRDRVRVRGDRLSAGPRETAERAPSWPPTRRSCKSLRGPAAPRCCTVLEQLPAASHPMDVLRTGVSALGCCCRRRPTIRPTGARDHRRPAAGLAWARCCATGITSPRTGGASRCRPTTIRSARISCICCTAASRRRTGCAPCTPRSFSTPSMSSTPRPSPRA